MIFASHSVHRHLIHSVDVNYCLADKPRVVSGLITQVDCSQSNAWVCSGQGAGVIEVSSMATSELADIVLPCILAEQRRTRAWWSSLF